MQTSARSDAARSLKTCLSTQADKNKEDFLDEKKAPANSNNANRRGDDIARGKRTAASPNSAYVQTGNPGERKNTTKRNACAHAADQSLTGSVRSVMQYSESLIKNQALFTQKAGINTVRKNIKSDAENLANGVSGIMPLLRNSLRLRNPYRARTRLTSQKAQKHISNHPLIPRGMTALMLIKHIKIISIPNRGILALQTIC